MGEADVGIWFASNASPQDECEAHTELALRLHAHLFGGTAAAGPVLAATLYADAHQHAVAAKATFAAVSEINVEVEPLPTRPRNG